MQIYTDSTSLYDRTHWANDRVSIEFTSVDGQPIPGLHDTGL